jgi:hypothetical protein
MARSILARRLVVGVQLTNDVPDERGGYRPTTPVTVAAVEHETAGTVLARFDVGLAMRFQPGQRLELAVSPEGASR